MYGRDADDTLDWIQEKDGIIASEDFGHDLESVRALISRHEGLEVSPTYLRTVFVVFIGRPNPEIWFAMKMRFPLMCILTPQNHEFKNPQTCFSSLINEN